MPPLPFGGDQASTEVGTQLPQIAACSASMKPIGCDSQLVGFLKIRKRSLDVLSGGSCHWFFDDSLPGSKLGEPLRLASVSTGYQHTAAVRSEGLQCDGHAPPFDSPKMSAISRNEYRH
jgi:hypothetical protein